MLSIYWNLTFIIYLTEGLHLIPTELTRYLYICMQRRTHVIKNHLKFFRLKLSSQPAELVHPHGHGKTN